MGCGRNGNINFYKFIYINGYNYIIHTDCVSTIKS